MLTEVRSEDHADEHILQERRGGGIGIDDTRPVKEVGQAKAAGNGHQHANQGDDKGRFTAMFQFVHVGFHTGAEHHHDDTPLLRFL